MPRHIFLLLARHRVRGKVRILLTYLWLTFRRTVRPPRNHVKILDYRVYFGDFPILYFLFEEIFVAGGYSAKLGRSGPVIIDGGANIGVATLYFKYAYPEATIDCFEPNPDNFALLARNIEENRLTGVRLHQAALSDHEGTQTMFSRVNVTKGDLVPSCDSVFAGHLADETSMIRCPVTTVSISSFLDRQVDLLKLDIEGYEGTVLQEADGRLRNVAQTTMEYHRYRGGTELSTLLKILEDNGHRYEIQNWSTQRNDPSLAVCKIMSDSRIDAHR